MDEMRENDHLKLTKTLEYVVFTWAVCCWSSLAVAGDAAHDQSRPSLVYALPVVAHLLDHPGLEVLDQHVRFFEELIEHLETSSAVQ